MVRIIIPALMLLCSFRSAESDIRSLDENICLNTEEQKLYELMMEYRKEKGLGSIPLSARLTKVAQMHATDLMENYTFSQDGKCNPHSWSAKGNWSACCYSSDHKEAKCMWDKPKEIAGYESPGYEIAYYSSGKATAKEGLQGWKKSEAHNPVILNDGIWKRIKWNAVGIGFSGNYGVVWFGEITDETTPVSCED